MIASVASVVTFACSDAYEEATPTTTDGGTNDAGVDPGDSGGISTATWLPREGTYRYRVDGRQRLSVGNPEYRDEGPVVPAEIRRDGPDCWHFRLCLVSGKCDDAPAGAYYEIDWKFCVANAQLEERTSRETLRWIVGPSEPQLGISTVTCQPGQAIYGPNNLATGEWAHVCQGLVEGKNLTFSTSGSYRYLGEEAVMVAGKPVTAHHFREERAVSANAATNGAPSGKQVGEWWLTNEGLPLRVRRGASIDTKFDPFGPIEFRQTGTQPVEAGVQSMDDCTLDSLEPSALPVSDAGNDGG